MMLSSQSPSDFTSAVWKQTMSSVPEWEMFPFTGPPFTSICSEKSVWTGYTAHLLHSSDFTMESQELHEERFMSKNCLAENTHIYKQGSKFPGHSGPSRIPFSPRELASMMTNLPTAKKCLSPGIPKDLPNTFLQWMVLYLNLRPLHCLSCGWEERKGTLTKNKARGIFGESRLNLFTLSLLFLVLRCPYVTFQ